VSTFARSIRPHVDAELAAADRCEQNRDSPLAFKHLERAHVLGQASTREHVRVHVRMLQWALRHGDIRELAGQLLRVIGAATLTAVGLVPTGNTGGANVYSWRRMPVPPELADQIAQAHVGNDPTG
jgi:hypothetical protein